ncbi:MAG TPA: GNAT family N-acetyltransferase [Candidatus Cybelea sp.]|jgi:ribosomal protein S18 acetylase RimI-like enzyme
MSDSLNAGSVITVEATQNDAEDLTELFDAYRVFYGRETDLSRARTFVRERLEARTTRFFLAKACASVVGFVHLMPSFDTLAMRPMWILEDLFVELPQRRLGIGSALLRHAEAFARENDAARLSLTTARTNGSAQRLYAAHKYERDELFWTYHRMLTD